MLLLLSNDMDAMLSGGLAKGRWAFCLRVVTEGGEGGSKLSSLDVTFLRKSQGLVKKLIYAGCVSFTVDWLFWNLYGRLVTYPLDLLSWKKSGIFSFENMGALSTNNIKMTCRKCCSEKKMSLSIRRMHIKHKKSSKNPVQKSTMVLLLIKQTNKKG